MDQKRCAVASKESLKRIFTVPEAPDSTLSKIELEISSNLAGFLNENIAAIEKPLHEIEKDFQAAVIPENPTFVSATKWAQVPRMGSTRMGGTLASI